MILVGKGKRKNKEKVVKKMQRNRHLKKILRKKRKK
jgi:hypothetical protein